MADFDAPIITVVGLARFDLPDYTIRLCDGGFVFFNGEMYRSADSAFGSIGDFEALSEQVGDEAPAGRLTFLPASTTAAAVLSQPGYQGSRIRFWLGRVDPVTGELVGDPDLMADLELDTTKLRIGKGTRALDVEFISVAERLFNINEGNVLSSRFHQSVWPGEQGFDNATGVPLTVAWGVQTPPRGSVYYGDGSGFGGGGGFFGRDFEQLQ